MKERKKRKVWFLGLRKCECESAEVWMWNSGSAESAILAREERRKEEKRWKRVVRMSVNGF